MEMCPNGLLVLVISRSRKQYGKFRISRVYYSFWGPERVRCEGLDVQSVST